jgi:hypothetical protein
MELLEKIESSIVAYLAGVTTWPASLKNAAGAYRIFSGESDQNKDGQSILVVADDAEREDPPFSGNFFVPVQILLKTPVTTQTARQKASSAPTMLANHSSAAAALESAINVDPYALAGLINSDGADFTIMGPVLDIRPQRHQDDNWHASGWTFRVYVTSKTIAN